MDPTLFTRRTGRAKNDANNSAREKLLEKLYYLETDDPIYLKLRDQWRLNVNSLCPVPFDTVRIIRRGGRNYYYDFEAYYYYEGWNVHRENLEFKFGAKRVEELPQFLNAPDGWKEETLFMGYFAEFYYTHYLPKYLACDTDFSIPIPTLSEYLNIVKSDSRAKKHAFFCGLKDRQSIASDAKEAVWKDAIREFLEQNWKKFDIAKFKTYLLKTQKGKTFVLYDDTTEMFYTQRCDFEQPLVLEKVINNNTIVIGCGQHKLQLLLRWKNGGGICNPAWQISLRK